MLKRTSFFDFITAERLYFIAAVFGIITIVIVGLIYLKLYQKKTRNRQIERLTGTLNDWISDIITEDEFTIFPTALAEFKATYLLKAHFRDTTIEQLIVTRKNLLGKTAEHIKTLYLALGLKEDSMRKFNASHWSLRTRGIYELYMMDQSDQLPKIFRLTNSSNEQIREEAQTAITGFLGFRALSFLKFLRFPITEWQQLKILDRLQFHNEVNLRQLPVWLQSNNESVVLFALKLAAEYQQYHVHDLVLHHIDDRREKVRKRAIRTLAAIANPNTAEALYRAYVAADEETRLVILEELANLGNPPPREFIDPLLISTDDTIRLLAHRLYLTTAPSTGLSSLLDPLIMAQVNYERQ